MTNTEELKLFSSATSSTDPSSGEFTLQTSSSSTEVDLEADNASTTKQLTFDAVTTNQMDVTGNLQITTASESTTENMQKVNPIYRAYQNTPQAISYNGYSTINYTMNGTSYSSSITTGQRNMLSDLQQKLDDAHTYGSGPSDPCYKQTDIST
ncbi:MAG: hypothetical protein WD016_11745 [Balneolaceae bacterium]